MPNVKTTLSALSQSLEVDWMKALGATNVQMVSERSARFDIPTTALGVNRIKVTLQENGQWRLRTYKVEELDDVPGILPDSLKTAITSLAGVK